MAARVPLEVAQSWCSSLLLSPAMGAGTSKASGSTDQILWLCGPDPAYRPRVANLRLRWQRRGNSLGTLKQPVQQ